MSVIEIVGGAILLVVSAVIILLTLMQWAVPTMHA